VHNGLFVFETNIANQAKYVTVGLEHSTGDSLMRNRGDTRSTQRAHLYLEEMGKTLEIAVDYPFLKYLGPAWTNLNHAQKIALVLVIQDQLRTKSAQVSTNTIGQIIGIPGRVIKNLARDSQGMIKLLPQGQREKIPGYKIRIKEGTSMGHCQSKWPAGALKLLGELRDMHATGTEIADELNKQYPDPRKPYTRNAVRGKIHRLEIEAGQRAPKPSAKPRTRRLPNKAGGHILRPSTKPLAVSNVVVPIPTRATGAPTARPTAPLPQKTAEVIPFVPNPVELLEIRENQCRWPMGDPLQAEFRFCGAKRLSGTSSYCSHHAGIAYVPNQPQKQRRA